MDTYIIAVLCLASFVISFFGVSQGVVLVVKMLTFTQPFSRKLTEHHVYELSVHKKLVFVEWVEHIIFIAISVGLAVMLITFGGIPCILILVAGFFIGLIYSLVINRSAIGITTYNVNGFRRLHSICMNMERFENYVRHLCI